MKILKLIKACLFVLFISLFFGACQWLTIEPVEIDIPDDVSFANDIQPIFTSKCITCHSSTSPVLTMGNAYNNLINGDYINTSAPASSVIVVKTNSGHGDLNPTEKALLLSWIEDGAPNN